MHEQMQQVRAKPYRAGSGVWRGAGRMMRSTSTVLHDPPTGLANGVLDDAP